MSKTCVVVWAAWCAAAAVACGGGNKTLRTGGAAGAKCATVEACTRACDDGLAGACTRMAERYVEGEGVPEDDERALAFYRKACDGGDGEGCEGVAASLLEKDPKGAEAAYRQAVVLYRSACDAGNAAACGSLGHMYEYARGGLAKDFVKAAELYRRACEAGEAIACFFLGSAYDQAKGVEHSSGEAARWYERTCELGDPDGCGIAANYYDDGTLPCNVAKARALRLRGIEGYAKQCREGVDWGCWSAAGELDMGFGVAEDKLRATELLKKGCHDGGRYSCGELAKRYEEGEAVEEDRDLALELHRKACELGEDDSCVGAWRLLSALGRVDEAGPYGERVVDAHEKGCASPTGGIWCQKLGEMYEKGTAVRVDKAKGAEYLKIAAEKRRASCLGTPGYDCSAAGRAYADGTGVKADPVVAADLLRRACEATAYACSEVGDRFANGKGVAADQAAAIAMWERGCSRDVPQSCLHLANAVERNDPARAQQYRARWERLSIVCETPDEDEDEGEGEGEEGGWDEAGGDPCGP